MTASVRSVSQWTGQVPRLQIQLFIAAGLVGVADWLFFGHVVGISYAVFLIVVAAATICSQFGRIRTAYLPRAVAVLVFALLPSLETFSPLTVIFASAGITAFVLISQGRFSGSPQARLDALSAFALRMPVAFIVDTTHLVKILKQRQLLFVSKTHLTVWVVLVVFSLIFLGLFTHANPLIERWLTGIDLTALADQINLMRWGFWCLVLAICWPFIRPRFGRRKAREQQLSASPEAIVVSEATDLFGEPAVFRALLLFNLLFAVQIGLDLTYLWAGAGLPPGMTYAAYAHRGAYTLICTALMAAGFVLFVTRKGSNTAGSRRVRLLVLAWTVQNVLLVMFCIQRLDLYIAEYALTYWRVAAFIWMALVLIGLGLIVARDVLKRSNGWLIEMNAVSLVAVLYVTSFVNVAAVIAHYNVSASLGPDKKLLDGAYLASLGADAIPMMDLAIAKRKRLTFSNSMVDNRHVLQHLETRTNFEAWAVRRDAAQWRLWSWRRHRLQNYLDTVRRKGVPKRQESRTL